MSNRNSYWFSLDSFGSSLFRTKSASAYYTGLFRTNRKLPFLDRWFFRTRNTQRALSYKRNELYRVPSLQGSRGCFTNEKKKKKKETRNVRKKERKIERGRKICAYKEFIYDWTGVYSFSRLNVDYATTGISYKARRKKKERKKKKKQKRKSKSTKSIFTIVWLLYYGENQTCVACSIEDVHTFLSKRKRRYTCIHNTI